MHITISYKSVLTKRLWWYRCSNTCVWLCDFCILLYWTHLSICNRSRSNSSSNIVSNFGNSNIKVIIIDVTISVWCLCCVFVLHFKVNWSILCDFRYTMCINMHNGTFITHPTIIWCWENCQNTMMMHSLKPFLHTLMCTYNVANVVSVQEGTSNIFTKGVAHTSCVKRETNMRTIVVRWCSSVYVLIGIMNGWYTRFIVFTAICKICCLCYGRCTCRRCYLMCIAVLFYLFLLLLLLLLLLLMLLSVTIFTDQHGLRRAVIRKWLYVNRRIRSC